MCTAACGTECGTAAMPDAKVAMPLSRILWDSSKQYTAKKTYNLSVRYEGKYEKYERRSIRECCDTSVLQYCGTSGMCHTLNNTAEHMLAVKAKRAACCVLPGILVTSIACGK